MHKVRAAGRRLCARTNTRLVRQFIMSLPGPFDSDNPQGAVATASNASGLADRMTLAEFRGELHLVGHAPVCVRTEPMLYRLALPERGPGVTSRVF